MKMYGGTEVRLHALLTSALDGGEWSASFKPGPGERALGTNWIGGCKIIVLPAVLHGCETWCLTLPKGYTMQVLDWACG